MGEIATRGMIRNMFSTFPTGNDAECLTKQELLSGSGNLMIISGGDTECVPLEAISFKPYPCKSQTDKAPLGDDVLRFPIRNENHHNIWFSYNVSVINLSMLIMNGLPMNFTKKEIGLNEESKIYGINVINRGNYLELYSIKNFNCPSGSSLLLPITINGTQYDIHIESI